jgi:hypothetical protein
VTGELAYLSLAEAAELIRAKKLSPVEYATALLARIERHDGKYNAFIALTPERALKAARESTFEVGRRFRCTMRIDCGQLDPGAVIRPEPGEWQPRMPERLDEEELADWRAGRNAVYQLAALTVGARLAVADA